MSSKRTPAVRASRLDAGGVSYSIHRLKDVEAAGLGDPSKLPFCLKILLENLIRHEDGEVVRKREIEALARWDPEAAPDKEIAFHPARVVLQDFTGVPSLVDLAAMRDAMVELGGDPEAINPLQQADLVVDHSVQVDAFGHAGALLLNTRKEFERNRERYAFLRWGQTSFRNFRVVPPETGIVHQVNLEYLARVVWTSGDGDGRAAYPDTLVGTDSHTTMINGLGVMGWGVGGIEAEAAMLGQPIAMLIPQVVGFRFVGRLRPGVTATDLVLTVTEVLRRHNVVGKFVEYFGEGLSVLDLPHRATIANMSPEYGATMGFFPVDAETLAYLRLTGRSEENVALVEAYAKEQGLFWTPGGRDASYSHVLEMDLSTVEPSLAGPRRPQDRVTLGAVKEGFRSFLAANDRAPGDRGTATAVDEVAEGSVVIAAITSCTNTSNPDVMLAAGLLARNAVRKGLRSAPWVKTSLAPGSKVVIDYLRKTDLLRPLEDLGFHLVGFGCTTCIGNSGPLPDDVSAAVRERDLVVAAVLSGNRNFEGRIHPLVRANYLASPPLVVAYAIAGTVDIDLTREPLGESPSGEPVYLRDVWPVPEEIAGAVRRAVNAEMFRAQYADVFRGNEAWNLLDAPKTSLFPWDTDSTYLKKPPFFDGMAMKPEPPAPIRGAAVLVMLGDSVTTDHISPAGSIPPDGPAGRYLLERGVAEADFNSFGSRRGNHDVMVRGTFGNIRLRNLLVPGVEGGWTVHFPGGDRCTIFDAAVRYREEGVPLVVLAGKEYGTGSSRDWAAKGTSLLGVRAVLAEGYERIHRSNLLGMGVLPLQFLPGEDRTSLGLDGTERFDIEDVADRFEPGRRVEVTAKGSSGRKAFHAAVRIDTPQELEFYRHGGILPYVLRRLLAA
jgi:aconitate hydratase